jgi:hypothetical protein
LSLCGGMGLGDLALFAACGGFGDGSGFSTACCFDSLCGCSASGIFSFAESAAHGGVGIISLMDASGLCGLASSGICGSGGGFSLCLGKEGLFTHLLGSAVPQLRAVLSAGRREVAIFCSMQIGPGVEDGHIFRGLCYCRIICLVRAARIHLRVPVRLVGR